MEYPHPVETTRTSSVATPMDAASPDAPNITGTFILIIALTAPESPGGMPVSVSTKAHNSDIPGSGDSTNIDKVSLATTVTPALAVTVPPPGTSA